MTRLETIEQAFRDERDGIITPREVRAIIRSVTSAPVVDFDECAREVAARMPEAVTLP